VGDADPRGLVIALAHEIARVIDDDAMIGMVLVSTYTADREQVHYFRTRGDTRVRRVLIERDADEAAQARDLLAQVAIDLTPPETP